MERDVIAAMQKPRPALLGARRFLCAMVFAGVSARRVGLARSTRASVSPASEPRSGWGVYIVNFVFWVGIAHSGTLISAVLFLFRVQVPRQLQPRRRGDDGDRRHVRGHVPADPPRPRVVLLLAPAVSEPASAVDELQVAAGVGRVRGEHVPDHQRRVLLRGADPGLRHRQALHEGVQAVASTARSRWDGWGRKRQWRNYNMLYALLAGFATPLVLSVHSVVSWDFAMGLVPGWHTTIFAPVLRGRRHLLGVRDGADAVHPDAQDSASSSA